MNSGPVTAVDLQQRLALCEPADQSGTFPAGIGTAIEQLLTALEHGHVRAAERTADGEWRAVPWVKRGILLGFRAGGIVDMSPAGDGPFRFFDKHTYPTQSLAL